ncbi:MAG: glycerophosphodiester phosphodiesterase [Acidimicrobiales bacterium]
MAFAHRGGRAHAPENTIAAFRLALEMGATALETDVWLTADGVAVCDHDGKVGTKPLRHHIGRRERAALPASIPALAEVYEACGTDFDLSVDVKAGDAAAAVVAAARAADPGAPKRLWLCHPDLDLLAAWREEFPDVRLVNSTRVKHVHEGLEKRAARMAALGIDAFNTHYTEWTGGHVALFHRFERLAFAWDAQHERVIRELVTMGIDGVYSDYTERLTAVLGS